MDYFGTPDIVEVIHASVERTEALEEVWQRITEATQEVLEPPNRYEWQPHVSILSLRRAAISQKKRLRLLQELQAQKIGCCKVIGTTLRIARKRHGRWVEIASVELQ